EPRNTRRALARSLSAPAALGIVPAIYSQWVHQSASSTGVGKGTEECRAGGYRLCLISLSESLACDPDLRRRFDLGSRLSASTKSLCLSSLSRSVIAYAGPGSFTEVAREYASRLQILRLVQRRERRPSLGLKLSSEPLYLLNTPWYTLRAQRVEQVGRSLLESTAQIFNFGLNLNIRLEFRSRRGKSEHYRAASPLTAGHPKT